MPREAQAAVTAAPTSAQEQELAQAVVEEAAAVVLVAATVPLAGRRAESAAPDVEQPAPLFSSRERAEEEAEVAAAVVQVAATVPLAERRAESAIPDGEQPALLFSSRERAEEAAVVAALSTSFSLPPEQAVPDRRSSFPLAARRVTARPPPEPRWIPQSPSVPVPLRSAPCSCEKR